MSVLINKQMDRKNNRPPKRRAAPTKIIDNSSIPEDEEEDELPHEYEEKILAMIDYSDSSDDKTDSSHEDDAKTSLKSEEEKKTSIKSSTNQKRTFTCISSQIIPKDNAPVLDFEEKTCEASSPILAARIITEELRSLLTGKKKNNFSYFMIIEEGETSKKFSYLATIAEEKCLVTTHPMKDIIELVVPVNCTQSVSEKSIGVSKRIPIPDQKQVIVKKVVPSLSDASKNVISMGNKVVSQELAPKKKGVKK